MKKIAAVSLFPLALAAYGAGYVVSSARKGARALRRILRSDWKTVSYGPLEFRTPTTWGDIEQTVDGMLVLHNRPARMRVDGDAVWYGSTIEIRVYRASETRPAIENAWRSWKRQFGSDEVPLVAELIVANGVRPIKEKEAKVVFKSLRLTGDPATIAWPEPGDTSIALRRIVPPHSSNIARDFESF